MARNGKNEKDSVSVIIPTWNRAETIEKAVRSVLNQTCSPCEVLVCDDGSTDDTRDIIKSIDDTRVQWLEGERTGRPALPRNRGMNKSKGDWLAFLDSDDEWLPEKLALQLAAVKESACLAASSNAYRSLPDQSIGGNLISFSEKRIDFDVLLRSNKVICSSAILHRSLLTKIKGFPEAPAFRAIEDYAFWLRVASITDFIFLPEPLLIYNDNLTDSIRNIEDREEVQKRAVFYDFILWGKEMDISSLYLNKVEQAIMELNSQEKSLSFFSNIINWLIGRK